MYEAFHKPVIRGLRYLGLLAASAVLLIVSLRIYEYAVTFHPVRAGEVGGDWKTPQNGGDVWMETRDGVRLHGWLLGTQGGPSAATIIYFHGNGGNIGNIGWLGENLSRRGFDVLLFDYRGYGRSGGSIGSEDDLYADADAAYELLAGRLKIPPGRIVLYGQSLGTTAAIDLAARKKCGAVIIESGLSSASSMASIVLPWLPGWLHRLARNRFDSVGKLPRIGVPVLIAHGEPDPVVPTSEGRKLFEAAMEPKKLVIVPGAGHNVFGSAGDRYLDQLASFIRESVAREGASASP